MNKVNSFNHYLESKLTIFVSKCDLLVNSKSETVLFNSLENNNPIKTFFMIIKSNGILFYNDNWVKEFCGKHAIKKQTFKDLIITVIKNVFNKKIIYIQASNITKVLIS